MTTAQALAAMPSDELQQLLDDVAALTGLRAHRVALIRRYGPSIDPDPERRPLPPQ